jgi:hypothetical protein
VVLVEVLDVLLVEVLVDALELGDVVGDGDVLGVETATEVLHPVTSTVIPHHSRHIYAA